jgi:hypothetical protein
MHRLEPKLGSIGETLIQTASSVANLGQKTRLATR